MRAAGSTLARTFNREKPIEYSHLARLNKKFKLAGLIFASGDIALLYFNRTDFPIMCKREDCDKTPGALLCQPDCFIQQPDKKIDIPQGKKTWMFWGWLATKFELEKALAIRPQRY